MISKTAKLLGYEADVVVSYVDVSKSTELSERFGMKEFPSVKFFPKTNKYGINYSSQHISPIFVKDFVLENI